MCGITTQFNVSQARCFECINFIVTLFNVRQTIHMCVASETNRGLLPTLDCVNFTATQFNVRQMTQCVASETCGPDPQFNVSQTPYSYIVQVLTTGKKKKSK